MGLGSLTGLGLGDCRRWGVAAWPRLVLGVLLLATFPPQPASSQVSPGASLTVVRGSVAVKRPDGTAIYPAGTGLTLAIGDIVGTLDRTRAFVTFFSGTEVELGSNTTIVIRRLDRDLLEEAQIGIENVVGLTVIRVPVGAPPGSAVAVVNGDTVAVIRSGEVGHGVDPDSNNVTVACVDGVERCTTDPVTFPNGSRPLIGQLSRTVTGRGDLIDQRVPAGTSVWDALAAGGSVGRQSESDDRPSSRDESDTPNSARPESFAAAAQSVTPTVTATPTGTITVTPDSTVPPTGTTTFTPTGTITPTITFTPTATVTPTATATVTATATATATLTSTATATPTATPPRLLHRGRPVPVGRVGAPRLSQKTSRRRSTAWAEMAAPSASSGYRRRSRTSSMSTMRACGSSRPG